MWRQSFIDDKMIGIDVPVGDGATLEDVAMVGTEGMPVDSMQSSLLRHVYWHIFVLNWSSVHIGTIHENFITTAEFEDWQLDRCLEIPLHRP